jgi:hypothetical protein
MSFSWFNSLGWWEQKAAYAAFCCYRDNPNELTLNTAIELAIPIIRVVYSTQKFKVTYAGDEDDLISHAAYTITKALPKMAEKPYEKLDDDMKYMRYLFTCVVNAFYREYDVLRGRHNKIQRKISEESVEFSDSTVKNIYAVEAELTLRSLPKLLYAIAVDNLRFSGQERKICLYILAQLITGREIAKSVLQIMGCMDRSFFLQYCQGVVRQAFLTMRENKPETNDFYLDYIGVGTEEMALFEGAKDYA